MSRTALVYTHIFLTIIISGVSNDFKCTNNECSCLNGECIQTCSSQTCNNKYFICSSSATLCLVNCNGAESCKYAKIYGAAANVVVNCNGTDSCTGAHVSCGIQPTFPNELSSYSTKQFTGGITDCFVNLLTPNAMRFGDVSCVGSIANCIIDAYSDHSISESLFKCKTDRTDGNGCQLNCIEPTSCSSIQFECNSALCSCGILDKTCENEAIELLTNIDNNVLKTEEQYNCMDLRQTELEIRSMAHPARDSTFHYEISGKDIHHHTILFGYRDIDNTLSTLHDIHHSVYFASHETYGNTYDFEWVFNEPNIICWLTQQLSAIKIDLFYNKNISFAFTYIYSSDILNKLSGGWMLTAKNNWNLGEIGVTYLENGFIYFDYEYNITLTRELTTEPTPIPTSIPNVIKVNTKQTITNDSPIYTEQTTHSSHQKVIESTHYDKRIDSKESIKANTQNNTDTPIKGLLFGITLLAMSSICCIIGCIIYSKMKQSKRMEAAYASTDGLDSEDEEDMHMINQGNQADIEEEDDDDVNYIQDIRIGSCILDENDLMDDAEYNGLKMTVDKRESHSQSSLIKKYKPLDPLKVVNTKREESESKSISESGIGYITKSIMILNGSDDDESMDHDISMDADYHHVITQQSEISLNQDMIGRLNDISVSESAKQVKRHGLNTTLGFEPGSVLEHYVNQDSTFQTLKRNEKEEEEESVSQSMSRLSQSLIIPPIELDKDITNVKMLKSKTTIESAADSMKKFSQKIANCAANFGHPPSNTNTKRKSNEMKENIMDENDYATIVIYKNSNTSTIPESQIVQSTTPPPIPMLNAVDICLEPESTQTMIVKTSKSLETQLSQIHQSPLSHDNMISDDSSSSSEDERDPIDASEEDDIFLQRKIHKKNLSNLSNKSHHDRATMIINDDLNIHHLVNVSDEDDDDSS